VEELLNILKALSEETRLRILKLLEAGELCVCDIMAALDMIQPKVSFHLGVLKEAGLIKDRKEGRWVHYRIEESDLFRRFLILSVLERVPENAVSHDKKRLHEFLQSKKLCVKNVQPSLVRFPKKTDDQESSTCSRRSVDHGTA
jgi:ArsR family transcriptional regulator